MIKSVKNIIFDFGGVIIPIDPMAFARGIMILGCNDILSLHESLLKEDVYTRFEKGEMSPADFRNELRAGLNKNATDNEIDHAWNLIIGKIPLRRVKFLESLKSNYRTFLLSNTNKIHYDYYQAQFLEAYGPGSLDNLFEKAYYSFHLGLYKPDPAIFEFVLKDNGLVPKETMFIDDSLVNVEAARLLGIQVVHLVDGVEIDNLIKL